MAFWYNVGVMETLPNAVRRLFWDVDPATVEVRAQRNFVLDRVLEYGGMEAVRWAEATYGLAGIRDYFVARGDRVLSQKTKAFWHLMLNESCSTQSSTTPSNPLWPY
jgi:hypothetical protein